MEAFVLSQELRKQGFKLGWGASRALNEVIVFEDDMLYSSPVTRDSYFHKQLLKSIQKGPTEEPFNASRYRANGVRAEEIVKTHYKWDLDIVLITPWQTITEVLNPEISFYRLSHEDATPRVSIHSLWLAIPEIVQKLEPFLLPEKGTTTLEKRGELIAENRKRAGSMLFIGDDNLSLIWETTKDGAARWTKSK